MEEIYVILAEYSDYDSQPYNFGFRLTEQEAEAEVLRLNKRENKLQEASSKIFDYFIEQRDKLPEIEHTKYRPKWKAGISQDDITKETIAINTLISANNSVLNKARNKIASDLEIAFSHTLGLDEGMRLEALKHNFNFREFRYENLKQNDQI